LGKPLKIMTHPLRADIPIYLGAEGPKNVAQTAEIADGWLPLYYSPYRQDVYADQIAHAKPGFEIASLVSVAITDDVAKGLWPVKASLGFYIGGMGAKGQNYHTKLMSRMGFEREALEIQRLFFEGRRDEAIAAVPDAFADEISLVGPPSRIAQRLDAWRDSPVTTLLVSARDADQLRQIRDLVKG
jgi:alkanesulfonate monooxygenase SsuD/methylene tetrahydromethanopterin reductase-like flavin-dependent oxidoreductase (luciferase family)